MAPLVTPETFSDPETIKKYYWSNELRRCQEDFEYLASNYLRIKAKDMIGFPTLQMRRVQRYLYQRIQEQRRATGFVRQVWEKARQLGATTLGEGLSFQEAAFKNDRNVFLCTHDEPSSWEVFDIVHTFYDALPRPMKPTLRGGQKAKTRIVFDNRNSKMLAAHALNMNVGASQMNHVVHLTEVARYSHPETIQASLFPTISEARGDDHSIVIMESTAVYGGDWFKDFAEAAIRGDTEYWHAFTPFYWHEAYTSPVPRDFELDPYEKEQLQLYGSDPVWPMQIGNLVWRRKEVQKYRSNPALVGQEFPSCREEAWALPKDTLRVFNNELIKVLSRTVSPPKFRATPTSTGLEPQLGGLVEVWETPQDGVFYDFGCDLAEGATAEADWSVGVVVRRDTLRQVAQFRVHMNPASVEFLDLVYWLGMAYHTAQINPDITGGWGNALLTELQMRNYPMIWRWRRRDDAKQRISNRLGFYYTKRDKATLVNNAVTLAAREEVSVSSEILLGELTNFLNIGLDEWGPAPGWHDDCPNAWMLALLSARDERIPQDPPSQDDKKTKKEEWKYHDVESDLNESRDRPLISVEPWRT